VPRREILKLSADARFFDDEAVLDFLKKGFSAAKLDSLVVVVILVIGKPGCIKCD